MYLPYKASEINLVIYHIQSKTHLKLYINNVKPLEVYSSYKYCKIGGGIILLYLFYII